MEAKLFSTWATAYCLKTQSCEKLFKDTIQFLRQEKFFNDSFFYLIVKVIRMIITESGNDANGEATDFLVFLMLSSNISEAQSVTLINLARESLPTLNMFWPLRQRLIEVVSLMIDEKITEKKQIICVLQLLDFLLSGMTSRSETLLFVYLELNTLATVHANYFSDRQLSSIEIQSLLNCKREQRTEQNISVFISQQARSLEPTCRGCAYKVLGLITTRCFEDVGQKVVVKLLLKNRLQEVPENCLIITTVLWNLLYIWPDCLSHVLIERSLQSSQIHWSLLGDLWGHSCSDNNVEMAVDSKISNKTVVTLRSICMLSAARVVVAKRLPAQQINDSIVGELVASFLLRSSVDRVIKSGICEIHQQGKSARKKSRKEKEHIEICTSVGTVDNVHCGESWKGDNKFKSDDLSKEDSFDFAVLRQLLIEGFSNGALAVDYLQILLVEALLIAMQRSVSMSIMDYKNMQGWAPVAITPQSNSSVDISIPYLQIAVPIWYSLLYDLLLNHNGFTIISDTNACVLEAIQKWQCNLQTDISPRLDDMVIADITQIFIEDNNPSLLQTYPG